jgi:hypothetical protein
MPKPVWVTPERQLELVRLFTRYGNRCLQGHLNCRIKDHYKHLKPIMLSYAIPKLIDAVERDGTPQRDSNGNKIQFIAYDVGYDYVYRKSYKMLYDLVTNEQIHRWLIDDNATYKAEYLARHKTNDRKYPVRVLIPENGKGKLSGVSKDIEFDKQPLFYLMGLGINARTFRPYAIVQLAYSYMQLHVDIGDCLKSLSKHKRRKAIRNNNIPLAIENVIYQSCWLAVADYLNE